MLRKDRISRLQDGMRARGIDAYLILTHDDYIWFFGEDRYQPRAIIPASGQPVIVTFRGEEEEVRAKFGVDDIRIFGSVAQQIRDVVEVMRELSGRGGSLTIGVQMLFSTPAFLLTMFQKANPQVTVVDIGSVMDELRMIKGEDEIQLMRRASEIADLGMGCAGPMTLSANSVRPNDLICNQLGSP